MSATRVRLTDSELADAKQKLRQAYLNEVGQAVEASEETEPASDDDDGDSEIASSSAIPIPPETRLERLCNASGLHPVSVVCILEQMTRDGLSCPAEVRRGTENYVSAQVLRMLGYQWPKDLERSIPLPDWSDPEGLIPLSEGLEKPALIRRISDRLRGVFDSPANRFEQRVGVPLERWLEREFYPRHIRQFRGRPIAWQVETHPSGREGTPLFSCMIFSHRAARVLPNLRTQYVGTLRTSFESELRTLEGLTQLSSDQSARKAKLGFWVDELRQFQETLEGIEARGFGTTELRRYAIGDAIHSMARWWLIRLRDQLISGPLTAWQEKAAEENLHSDLPRWIAEAVQHIDRQCVLVAPEPPATDTSDEELTPQRLAEKFRGRAAPMVRTAVEALCREWQAQFDRTLVQPLREQVKADEEECKQLEDAIENKLRRKDIKLKVKALKKEIASLSAKSRALADGILDWRCLPAENWFEWLAEQPLYDELASPDGRRSAPANVAEFVNQESQYAPDINDGVRVNIGPLQKAGILARDVLAAKDVDKAIADRAEWRADERRWCRQGVLPRPGWWLEPNPNAKQVATGEETIQ